MSQSGSIEAASRSGRFSRTYLTTFIFAFVATLTLSTLWIIASPLMSVPDEPSHTVKAAAVIRGQLGGVPASTEGQTLFVQVPEWAGSTPVLSCYKFVATSTPACVGNQYDDDAQITTAATTAGNYNPVYYAFVGLPSLAFEGKLALYSMRFASAILTCVFIASMFGAIAALRQRKWLIVAAVVAITPMALYLTGSINPNSLEFATAGAVFANLSLILERQARGVKPQLFTVGWVVVAAMLLGNTKGPSLLWLLVAVLVPFIAHGWKRSLALFRSPLVVAGMVLIGLSAAFAIWWIISRDALASAPFGGAGTSAVDGAIVMLTRTFDYYSGLVGYFGWLDTPAPSFVLLVWAAITIPLVVTALVVAHSRHRASVIVALAALVLTPIAIQSSIVTQQGFVWQGRYVIALFVVLMLAVGAALDTADIRFTPRTRSVLRVTLVFAAAAQLYAFIWTLRRYVTGISDDVFWSEMLLNPQWTPPGGWIWLVATYAIALMGICVVLSRWIESESRRDDLLPTREPPQESRSHESLLSL